MSNYKKTGYYEKFFNLACINPKLVVRLIALIKENPNGTQS
jgi:hypothetical protein